MIDIKISREEKQMLLGKIQTYFYQDRGEEIGDLAAENLYHFFLNELGPSIYNQGIEDSKKMVIQKMENVDEDLEALKRMPKR
ncbi:DUF2164 domain-containing protein [Falsibacillus pallidus]|uniref:Uncharacterized protein (DUF2164 family) n=1 Tax=Falsibacillus pallidus TaxID=493781 RepID=A0A370GIZ0_9BACI|nr:DUF2164 domain-containing protein [Falsibacillus pallidus]RDI43186.1 uncharacterized protein (DUF2164 family) [Falsibacillus pallidus]